MDIKRKVMTGKVVDAPKGKPIVAVVSTEDVDLAGDIIKQGPNDEGQGWITDGFNQGGRIYWMHNPMLPNLAKATARVDDDRLLLSVEFDQGDEFAREIDRKYREGYLTEWSVGFRPVEGKYIDNEHGGFTFFEQVLDEVSAVNQGMNPNTSTISKGFADYLDAVSEYRAIIDQYERRLRDVEAYILRAQAARDEDEAREALEILKRARAAV